MRVSLALAFIVCCIAADTPQPPESEEAKPKDLTQEPGHLKPFGYGKKPQPMSLEKSWPAGDAFYQYLETEKPFIVPGGAKFLPGYEKWTLDYFRSKKDFYVLYNPEITDKDPENITRSDVLKFPEAIERLDQAGGLNLFIFHGLMEDIALPPPLKCADTIHHIELQMSKMGKMKYSYSSEEHETITCAINGKYTLYVINSSLPLTEPDSIEFNKVNFTSHPELANAEFSYVEMNKGDCMFIPVRWHQFTSEGSKGSSAVNIGMNILFSASDIHIGKNNDTPEEGKTLCEQLQNVSLPDRMAYIDAIHNTVTKVEDCLFHAPITGFDKTEQATTGEPRTAVTVEEANKCSTDLFVDNFTADERAAFIGLDTDKDGKVSDSEWNEATSRVINATTNETEFVVIEKADTNAFFFGLRERAIEMFQDKAIDDEEEPNSQDEENPDNEPMTGEDTEDLPDDSLEGEGLAEDSLEGDVGEDSLEDDIPDDHEDDLNDEDGSAGKNSKHTEL